MEKEYFQYSIPFSKIDLVSFSFPNFNSLPSNLTLYLHPSRSDQPYRTVHNAHYIKS